MSEVAKRLRDRRLNVWNEASALADKAAEDNRSFTAEEEGEWQRLNAELDALDARIKNVLDGEQRAKDVEAAFDRLDGNGSGKSGAGRQENRGRAQGGSVRPEQGSGELRSWMRGESGGRYFEVHPEGPTNFRALSVGTLTAGGDTVPTSFYDRLVQHLIVNSAILQAGVTVIQTAGGEVIQVPKTTAHSTAALIAEGGSIGESDPTFGQVPLGAYKYGTLVQVSRELLDDTGVDLEGYLAMQAGRALGNAFGAHAITGDGSSKPHGLVVRASLGKTGTAASPTYEDLVDLQYSVIAPYRKSQACYWMLNDTTVAVLRKMRTNIGGAGTGMPIWEPSTQIGAPDMLLGKPVLTDPNIAGVDLSAKSIVFGDMSQYFVRMAGGIRFERSDDYAFNTDLVTFRALMRADGDLVDQTGAVKYFAGSAS